MRGGGKTRYTRLAGRPSHRHTRRCSESMPTLVRASSAGVAIRMCCIDAPRKARTARDGCCAFSDRATWQDRFLWDPNGMRSSAQSLRQWQTRSLLRASFPFLPLCVRLWELHESRNLRVSQCRDTAASARPRHVTEVRSRGLNQPSD
jgi:hypothetical protein